MTTLRNFVDLHVMPRPDDVQSYGKTAELLRMAGFKAVGLTVPTGLMSNQIHDIHQTFVEAGLEVFTRADLVCSQRRDLLKMLRHFRNRFDIISVRCSNHNVALVAARDRRVDLIFFDPAQRKVWFDHSTANVSHAALEFNMSALYSRAYDSFTKIMKDFRIAIQHNVRIVLSSGCWSPIMVRTPTQLSAVGIMLGLKRVQAHDGVSSIPWSLVTKNSERRSNRYLEDGVRLITGKDSN